VTDIRLARRGRSRIRQESFLWPGIRGLGTIVGYSIAIAAAELSGSLFGPLPGAILDGALVPVILAHFVLSPSSPCRRMLPSLALIALLRTLSLAAVVPKLPEVAWYTTIGAPMLLGVFLASRLNDAPVKRFSPKTGHARVDITLTLLGVPLSLVGFLLLQPARLIATPDATSFVAAMAILAVFAAGLEELLYRGLLLTVATDVFGSERLAVVYAATLAAVMYWGSGSLPFTIAIWILGLAFGTARRRGASLWGLIASHAVILWGMALVWPAIIR
jgi:membrane protease YdiL (CAAX protease family)